MTPESYPEDWDNLILCMLDMGVILHWNKLSQSYIVYDRDHWNRYTAAFKSVVNKKGIIPELPTKHHTLMFLADVGLIKYPIKSKRYLYTVSETKPNLRTCEDVMGL